MEWFNPKGGPAGLFLAPTATGMLGDGVDPNYSIFSRVLYFRLAMGPCLFHVQWETASKIYSKYWSLLILLKVMVKLFDIPAPVLNPGAFFFGSRALLHVVTSGKADPTPGKLHSFFNTVTMLATTRRG